MVNMMERNFRRNRLLESYVTLKGSCVVRRGAVGKVFLLIRNNSLAAYSTLKSLHVTNLNLRLDKSLKMQLTQSNARLIITDH
jgi:hypothetical protein